MPGLEERARKGRQATLGCLASLAFLPKMDYQEERGSEAHPEELLSQVTQEPRDKKEQWGSPLLERRAIVGRKAGRENQEPL